MAKQYKSPPPVTIDAKKKYTAAIDTTLGSMEVEFFPCRRPQARQQIYLPRPR